MNFRTFQKLDPVLAEQFLEAVKFQHEVSEWEQSLRDQMYRRLVQLGKSGLGDPVYQDKIRTEYASIDTQAAAIDDPILNPLVAELESKHSSYERNAERLNDIHDAISKKHGLIVGVEVFCDSPIIEDQYVFEADQ